MSVKTPTRSPSRRQISHAAIVCFTVSAVAFVACGMGLFVNHMLTGSLAISGTAAVGLIYLAMGILNLGHETETLVVEPSDSYVAEWAFDQPKGELDVDGGNTERGAELESRLSLTEKTRGTSPRRVAHSVLD